MHLQSAEHGIIILKAFFFPAGMRGNSVPAPPLPNVGNGKGCWRFYWDWLLGDLLLLDEIYFLCGSLLLLLGDLCCWGSTVAGRDLLLRRGVLWCWLLRDLLLLLGVYCCLGGILSKGLIVSGSREVYCCWRGGVSILLLVTINKFHINYFVPQNICLRL